jgi:hypothetical protein
MLFVDGEPVDAGPADTCAFIREEVRTGMSKLPELQFL